MKPCWLYHNLGLGDHLICNALVRKFAATHSVVRYFIKEHNFESVAFMLRDLKNIEYKIVNTDTDVQTNLSRIEGENIAQFLVLGDQKNPRNKSFDEIIYGKSGMAFSERWSQFHFVRDGDRERNLFERLRCPGNYVFVHDDPSRGYSIDTRLISGNPTIIKPNRDLTNVISDYCLVLEKANEIHCIDSTFRILTDSIKLNTNPKLFFHRYARPASNFAVPKTIKNWATVNKPFLVHWLSKKCRSRIERENLESTKGAV